MAKFFVHESSYGDDTKIWHILSGSNIGTNCSFGQNCVVGPKVNIGNGSIYEGVVVEDDVFLQML